MEDPVAELYVSLVREYDREEHFRVSSFCDCPAHLLRIVFAPATPGRTGAMFPIEGNPLVEIYRQGWVDPGDYFASEVAAAACDPLGELVHLAHELGHHHLVIRGFGSGLFEEADPVRTYEEEVGAWLIGRQLLEVRKFRDWDRFDIEAASGLNGYRTGLRLDDADEIEGGVWRRLAVCQHEEGRPTTR